MKIIIYEQNYQIAEMIECYLIHLLKRIKVQIVCSKKDFERVIQESQSPFIIIIGTNEFLQASYTKIYSIIPENTFVIFYDFQEMLHVKQLPEQNSKKPFLFQNRVECYLDMLEIIKWLKEQNCPIQTS
ncbi:MAG: hypothetical protein PHN19_03135 [Patescibacteria group bacterium]|nr:hypothetical protein [Patescibacteria group bacterium]